MLKVDLMNVQAISEAHIIFPNNTITEFTGNNSNGKSILSKVIEYMTKGDLIHKDVREALIKDGTPYAVILFTMNKKQLGLKLGHELKESIIMYVPDIDHEKEQGGQIVRALSDSQACELLIREFGFRTYAKGDICLQLAPTFGAIPFVTTSGSVNNDIVTDITIDKVADEFLTSFKTITFPTFKNRIQRLTKEKEHLQELLDNMESYDWHAYEELATRMNQVYRAIAYYKEVQIDEIPIPPLETMPLSEISIGQFPIITAYDYIPMIDAFDKELEDYVSVLNGTCPTCGRPLVEH